MAKTRFKYLKPEDIRKLAEFEFAPRALVEGYLSGRHRSLARGSSIEFRDYRHYVPGDGVEVRVQHGTIWLSQKNLGLLFETTPENVLMHIKNIYAENELLESATANEFLAVQTEGKRQVQRRHTQGVAMGGLRMPLRGTVICRGILGNCRRLQELHRYAQ